MASAPKFYDRVQESSTTTGTGTYTLAGAITGFQSFAAVGDGNSCYYCAQEVDANGNPSGGWEVGLGTYTASGTTLSRDTILASSNSNAAVSWAAGTRRIFICAPAAIALPVISDFGGRLTTESGVGVSTSNRTAQGTLYYTPYLSTVCPKWNGSGWERIAFSEVSLALTLTVDKNYDVFFNGTALSLSAAWTNDSTRADALATQDGVTVLSADHTKLWVGTIRASGANVIEDSATKRFVYNAYNQVHRVGQIVEATSHTYNSNTPRSWNNDANTQVAVVLGGAAAVNYGMFASVTAGTGANGDPGVYSIWDWTSGAGANDEPIAFIGTPSSFALAAVTGSNSLKQLAAGYHYLRGVEVEFSGGTVSTFARITINADLVI